MVLFLPGQEEKIKAKLVAFLRKKYPNSKQKANHCIFHNFAPDFYFKQKNSKERIIIFRNPPEFPMLNVDDIRLAQEKGIGVYIAIFNHELDPLLESFIEKCDEFGVGIIQCSSTYNFQILQPCRNDFPRTDKIVEGRIKFFVSSKLWIPEREIVRQALMKYKHQPICIERLHNQDPLITACFKWIDKSQFFIGIITPQYRPLVDKEIRYALKKKEKKCVIFIKTDCFQQKRGKLKQLVEYVKEEKIFEKFNCPKELGRMTPNHVAELVASYTK